MMRFILLVLRMTSSKMGCDPPTNPVLPPCGTTAIFSLLQYFKISEISSVVDGFNISFEWPTNFFVQSLFHYSNSSTSVMTAFFGKIDSKCVMSASVTTLNLLSRSTFISTVKFLFESKGALGSKRLRKLPAVRLMACISGY